MASSPPHEGEAIVILYFRALSHSIPVDKTDQYCDNVGDYQNSAESSEKTCIAASGEKKKVGVS